MHFLKNRCLTAHIREMIATGAYHQSQFLLSTGLPICFNSSFSRIIATLSSVSGMTSGAVLQEHSTNSISSIMYIAFRFILALLCCSG